MTGWDIGHYMKFVTGVETQGDKRIYHVGDNFQIDVTTGKHTPENEMELVAGRIKLLVEAGNVEEEPLVGRIRFASGEQIEYTDSEKYIEAIREELPYRLKTGFKFQTLTKDPVVRKAVDDEIYNFYGEENPRRLEEYQEQDQEPSQEVEVQELGDEEPEL